MTVAPFSVETLVLSPAANGGFDDAVRKNPQLKETIVDRGHGGSRRTLSRDQTPANLGLIPGVCIAYHFDHVLRRGATGTGASHFHAHGGRIVTESNVSNSVLRHNGDPRQPWTMQEIDRLPTSHRLRWADIDGSGHRVVVNQPLTAATVNHPEDRAHTPLVFYRPGEWKRETISDQDEGVVHCIYPVDWDGTGRDGILTASFVGIHLYRLGAGGAWSRTEIAKGDPAPWPKSGSSDVAVGHLGHQRFVAAIEPWHGNQVAIYREQAGQWQRHVIDDSLSDGHTIWTGDLNGDGRDEVVAGYRAKGVNIYSAEDDQGREWSKQVLDPSISAAACAIADLNGDGRPDIACIGSATANLKWYENLGPR